MNADPNNFVVSHPRLPGSSAQFPELVSALTFAREWDCVIGPGTLVENDRGEALDREIAWQRAIAAETTTTTEGADTYAPTSN